MAERRQAHRREPIEVEVRDKVLEAHPLSWIKRNDLGNEIMRQYADLLNSSLRAVKNEDPEAPPELQMYLNDKIADPIGILRRAYPSDDLLEFFEGLEYDEVLELIYASLEVNQLESLRGLIDPNFRTPTTDGGNDSPGTEEEVTDTPNQPSSPDSSSQESQEMPS